MPPTGRATRYVRRNNATNNTKEEDSLSVPYWITDITSQQVAVIKTLVMKILSQKEGIAKLERHLTDKTTPKSLQINVNVQVSKSNQEGIDKVVADAAKRFQETVLNALLKTRERELADMELDHKTELEYWDTLVDKKVQLLQENGIEVPPRTIDKARDEYESRVNDMTTKVKTKFILDKANKEEKNTERQTKHAEQVIEKTLANGQTSNFQKELQQLRNKVNKLQKNAEAKSGKPNPDGGPRKGGRPPKPNPKAQKNPKKGTAQTKQSSGSKGASAEKGRNPKGQPQKSGKRRESEIGNRK